jgi:hypothetical protein
MMCEWGRQQPSQVLPTLTYACTSIRYHCFMPTRLVLVDSVYSSGFRSIIVYKSPANRYEHDST